MKIYQVELKGFDGTEQTLDRVKWIKAESLNQAERVTFDKGWDYRRIKGTDLDPDRPGVPLSNDFQVTEVSTAKELLKELDNALRAAWYNGTLSASVVPSDLAQRVAEYLRSH